MLVWQRLSQMVSDSGIPQAEIARRIGEHRNWVNNRVNGAVDLRADELPRCAAAVISRQAVAPFTTLPPTME